MRGDQPLGLDELMIVNPGPTEKQTVLLGEDGTLYQVQGLTEEGGPPGPGECFLGDDGVLYRVAGCGEEEVASEVGQLFLGADATLYRLESIDPAAGAFLSNAGSDRPEVGRFFLGEDGTLYELMPRDGG